MYLSKGLAPWDRNDTDAGRRTKFAIKIFHDFLGTFWILRTFPRSFVAKCGEFGTFSSKAVKISNLALRTNSLHRHFSDKFSAFYHTKQTNLELFKQKLQKTAWTAPSSSSKMRRISKREITDFNETSWESGPQCGEFKNAEKSAENWAVFLIANSI